MNYGHIIKECKPDNFKSRNSLQLSFTNIWGPRSNFVESNSPDVLAPCETNLDDSNDSGNFSVRGYLPLIRQYSTTHMHGLTVYVKEELFLHGLISSKLCRLLLIFSTGFTSFSVLLLFLYRSPSLSLCKVFDSISSNIDEILSIRPSANVCFLRL